MPDQTPAVGMERRLAAIFSTDVAGYSRLMGDDEEATIRTLTAYRTLLSSLIQRHRGRVVDSPGDNLLAEFASVVDAVRCAVEIQHELKVKNADLSEHRQMQFRIGINLGDVIVEGERLYGDGVNIAARLESLALPGGICISRPVYDQVETKLALSYEDLGEQTVKNIAKPVRVYRILLPSPLGGEGQGEGAARAAERQKAKIENAERRAGFARRKWPMMAAVGLIFLVGAIVKNWPLIVILWQLQVLKWYPPPEGPPPAPIVDKPSIVVLPFDNMSKDPEQDYFSNGITEVLTSDLSRISSLFVIARNTAFTYQRKAVNIQDVGKELGIRYVLEGSVQKAGEQLRIVAQLIDTTTGGHLWSQRYDRELKDIFTLQDEVIKKIVLALKVKLAPEEEVWLQRQPTANLEAYEYVLRGLESLYRFTKEANSQARQLFEKALALDPQYAGAYALLGETYFIDLIFQWSQDPQNLERAFELAQRARALDDSLSEAHQLLSQVYLSKNQPEQAITAAERAIVLDPNYADNYNALAITLSRVGRPEEAIGWAEKAIRLDPRGPAMAVYLQSLGWAYHLTGQVEEAIATQKQALMHDPSFIYAYLSLANSYLLQWIAQQSPAAQTLEPALAAIQRALALHDSLHGNHLTLGYIYLYQQRYDQALAEMERTVALAPTEADSHAALAGVLSCVGRTEDALEAAAQALRLKPFIADSHLVSVGSAYAVAGRYEEAIAPLKQYLSRYPNILHAHLTLAAVYSELGQAAEARAEVAEVLRLNPNFSLAVHKQRMPIKDPAVLERHIAALKQAGLK